jgi:hypothetical protein
MDIVLIIGGVLFGEMMLFLITYRTVMAIEVFDWRCYTEKEMSIYVSIPIIIINIAVLALLIYAKCN